MLDDRLAREYERPGKGKTWDSPRNCLADRDRNAMVWGNEDLPSWAWAENATVENHVLLGAWFRVIETEELVKDLNKKYGQPCFATGSRGASPRPRVAGVSRLLSRCPQEIPTGRESASGAVARAGRSPRR
jgi:hypothetical protein